MTLNILGRTVCNIEEYVEMRNAIALVVKFIELTKSQPSRKSQQ